MIQYEEIFLDNDYGFILYFGMFIGQRRQLGYNRRVYR